MVKIQSLEQYKETVGQAKKEGCTLSNCFFLPAALSKKISEGTLYFRSLENGLLLLDDNVDFYRCYYFLPASGDPGRVELNKQSVIEFPFNGEMNGKQLLQLEKIQSLGFILGRESGLMSAPADQILLPEETKDEYRCVDAIGEDIPQILELLNLSFNRLYAFLPDRDELEKYIQERRVLVIREGEKIAAVLISSFEKKVASINQVAVDPAYRGKKLGKTILRAYHSKYINEDAVLFQHWVDKNNAVAVCMYQNHGYKFGVRYANEYILI